MLIPSYDFGLFDIREFSPLQAQEFGADTYFSANTPLNYVDFALNQFSGLTQPLNPTPYIANSSDVVPTFIPQELQRFFQNKDSITVYPSGTTPPELQKQGGAVKSKQIPCEGKPWWWSYLGWCCPFEIKGDECVLHSDDSSVGYGGGVSDAIAKTFPIGQLPQGAGVFLVGVIILVLLILFVRK